MLIQESLLQGGTVKLGYLILITASFVCCENMAVHNINLVKHELKYILWAFFYAFCGRESGERQESVLEEKGNDM